MHLHYFINNEIITKVYFAFISSHAITLYNI